MSTTPLSRLVKRFGGRCVYCGRKVKGRHLPADQRPTRDHVIPKSRAQGRRDNTVLACFRCNQDKRARTPAEWTDRWYYLGTGDPSASPVGHLSETPLFISSE